MPVVANPKALIDSKTGGVVTILIRRVWTHAAHVEIDRVTNELHGAVTHDEIGAAGVLAAEPFDALMRAVVWVIQRTSYEAECVIASSRSAAGRITISQPGSLSAKEIALADHKRVACPVFYALKPDFMPVAAAVEHAVIGGVLHAAGPANADVVRFREPKTTWQTAAPSEIGAVGSAPRSLHQVAAFIGRANEHTQGGLK